MKCLTNSEELVGLSTQQVTNDDNDGDNNGDDNFGDIGFCPMITRLVSLFLRC